MRNQLAYRIHAFFQEVWDPAGVRDCLDAWDEYQAYEGTLLGCMRQGAMNEPDRIRAFVVDVEEAIRGEAEPGRVNDVTAKLTAFVRDAVEDSGPVAAGQAGDRLN